MSRIELTLILVAFAVGLGILARRLRLPYPILLVVGGLLLAVQPWAPPVPPLEPDLVFVLFLPPLLYAAAFNTPWPAFRTHLRAITLLAVGLVLFTAAAVAAVAFYLIGLPWEVGFVLGAIVAPPDAVAAVSVTRRVKVSPIVVTLLEGESLVNDASSLVAYRLAVAAVTTGVFHLGDATLEFAKVSVGGIALGLLAGVLIVQLHFWLDRFGLTDAKLTITLTLLTPFAIYIPAERLHVSGVLAVVTAGLWVGHRADRVFPTELMLEARAVWEWVEFLLNSLIFTLIGFQLPAIIDRLSYHPTELGGWAVAVTAAMVVARFVWVFPGAYLPRWLDRQFFGCGDPYPSWQNVTVLAWTGMRGVVSLAAALALPHGFPHRDLILFLTFCAIFGTLVGQGLTLPSLIRWLNCARPPDPEPPTDKASC